eukprot:TRINITY_DN3767_c1_g1_i1.p1 TRINITY_DN3767_c1_g1~~TRINITY_DN3767_c1_g1_i1.p1  ORF type:complete len:134 (-),score=0.99 TRINITY_DN3767_c1_g1_i1:141-542(-)
MASAFPSYRPAQSASSHSVLNCCVSTPPRTRVLMHQAPLTAPPVTAAALGVGNVVATGLGTANTVCAAVHADPAGVARYETLSTTGRGAIAPHTRTPASCRRAASAPPPHLTARRPCQTSCWPKTRRPWPSRH